MLCWAFSNFNYQDNHLIAGHKSVDNGCYQTCIWRHIIRQKSDVFNMETHCVTSVVTLLYLYSESVRSCGDILRIKRPLNGHSCVADTSRDVTLHRSAYPQCVWRCLRTKTCRFVNHNSTTDECQLGLSNCEFLWANVGFVSVVFRQSRHDCLKWGPIDEEGRVPVEARRNYVARIVTESALLLGKFDTKKNGSGPTTTVSGQAQYMKQIKKYTFSPLMRRVLSHGWLTQRERRFLLEPSLEVTQSTGHSLMLL